MKQVRKGLKGRDCEENCLTGKDLCDTVRIVQIVIAIEGGRCLC
jgi:hypothetical protein